MMLEEIKKEIKKMNEEKLTAAYSLNMCMVSISQIVDYQDINIMEQEYNAILNNINLENISKDEALLEVIKQILNVITFFRIQDGDKAFIEKEYKHKMKNAIWSAIPSPGVIMPSNPAGLAISLAAMVGTGYMNYRKAKANIDLEHEKELWKLQRAAIEQLNGLRREMFNASWKFAEHYQYPDKLRLTENQIKQYNDILLDSNVIRKYQRLWEFKDKFYAYPSFWYYLGNAANEIYMLSDPTLIKQREEGKYSEVVFSKLNKSLDEEERLFYKNQALKCFEIYWLINERPLLREDPIACSCALEYADLLTDKTEKIKYLDLAFEYGGNLHDVLQLCAIGYIKNAETEKAVNVLNILVNANYNPDVNIQLLSNQYIRLYREMEDNNDKRIASRADYQLLRYRIDEKYVKCILSWPDDKAMLDENEFLDYQKSMIIDKYCVLISEIKDKYAIKFAKLLPGPDINKEYSDDYYMGIDYASRKDEMQAVFNVNSKCESYRYYIESIQFAFDYIDLCNEMFATIDSLEEVSESIIEDERQKKADEIVEHKDLLLALQDACMKHKFDFNDFSDFLKLVDAKNLDGLFNALEESARENLNKIERLDQITKVESNIMSTCEKYDLKIPVVEIDNRLEDEGSGSDNESFSIALLGDNALKYAEKNDLQQKMRNCIKEYADSIVKDSKKVKFKVKGESHNEIYNYFKKNKIRSIGRNTNNILAVLDDMSASNYDIIFTTNDIICVYGRKQYDAILYSDVSYNSAENYIKFKRSILQNDVDIKPYKNKNVDLKLMIELIDKLNEIINSIGSNQ